MGSTLVKRQSSSRNVGKPSSEKRARPAWRNGNSHEGCAEVTTLSNCFTIGSTVWLEWLCIINSIERSIFHIARPRAISKSAGSGNTSCGIQYVEALRTRSEQATLFPGEPARPAVERLCPAERARDARPAKILETKSGAPAPTPMPGQTFPVWRNYFAFNDLAGMLFLRC